MSLTSLPDGTIVVSEVICEDIAMSDTVLVVSQGGIRRLRFTSTRNKEFRVAVIVADYVGTQMVELIFGSQSEALSDVVILAVIGSSSCQIHGAASTDSLSAASAASENFFKVLAVATDLGEVQRTSD